VPLRAAGRIDLNPDTDAECVVGFALAEPVRQSFGVADFYADYRGVPCGVSDPELLARRFPGSGDGDRR
jgi:hypothetical protein